MIGCSLARFAKFQAETKNFQLLEREKNVCRYFLLAASEMPEWNTVLTVAHRIMSEQIWQMSDRKKIDQTHSTFM